jgi:hypothetical protein
MTGVHRDTILRLLRRVGDGCDRLMDAEFRNLTCRRIASRLSNRVQLSSDSLAAYVDAVDRAFGSNVDYGQIVKSYEAEPIGPGRYSPPKVVGVEVEPVWGNPDPAHISTSDVERQNLTVRMQIRRLTRLTNAFSKTPEGLKAAVALHFAHYNFVRRHRSIRVTPAMEAGITPHLWSMGKLLDAALSQSKDRPTDST